MKGNNKRKLILLRIAESSGFSSNFTLFRKHFFRARAHKELHDSSVLVARLLGWCGPIMCVCLCVSVRGLPVSNSRV